MQSKTDRKVYPEGILPRSYKTKPGADPPIAPRDGIYPRYVVSGLYGITSKL